MGLMNCFLAQLGSLEGLAQVHRFLVGIKIQMRGALPPILHLLPLKYSSVTLHHGPFN